jgi:hypothetical protein
MATITLILKDIKYGQLWLNLTNTGILSEYKNILKRHLKYKKEIVKMRFSTGTTIFFVLWNSYDFHKQNKSLSLSKISSYRRMLIKVSLKSIFINSY